MRFRLVDEAKNEFPVQRLCNVRHEGAHRRAMERFNGSL